MLRLAVYFVEALYSNYFWILTIIAAIYAYLKFFVYTYWERHGVTQETPKMPFSNALAAAIGTTSLANHFKNAYEKFSKHRFVGLYMFYQPVLMINDPELIKDILVKDFNKFRDRGVYHNDAVDPMTSSLFFLPGEKWRKLRAKLTPTFTSKKLKEMFSLLTEISDEMIKTTDRLIKNNDIIQVKDLIARYTTDSICSVVYGFNCDSLNNPESEFKRYSSFVFDHAPIKNFWLAFAYDILNVIRMPVIHKEASRFFQKSFDDMVDYRKKNNIVRKDFMNLLIQLMDNGMLDDNQDSELDQDKLTLLEARAQAFIFFLGGFETGSSTMTYLLCEIAQNSEIQEKLHQEVDEFFSKGEITYDRIKDELKYLDMAFSETLRKHPSFGVLNRLCIEDWQIPDSHVTIKKGTSIVISVSGIHHNPEFYPDPEKFDPNRFTEENIASRSPYVNLSFGRGPRNCIGARFGIIQTKIALATLLKNYKVLACDKTVFPLPYSKRSYLQTPTDVYLRFVKRF